MAVSTATAWTRRGRPLGVIGLAARRSLCRTADSSSKAAGCSGRAASSSLALETDSNQSWGNNLRGLGHNNYLGKILNARVYEAAHETPLQPAKALSSRTGCQVLLKREDLQPVNSFKIRGAYNMISQLSHEQRAAGIVACSAGNHAQGVAFSAIRLGIDAVIIMPTGTPSIKVDAVRKMGGRVVLHGATYDEAAAEAHRLVKVEGRTLIHPFDDPLVIAGQGTIGMEILKQMTGKPLHAIFVCCGGGGMLAGIAAYVKRVRPGVLVIGVEAADAAGMTASLRKGRLQELDHVGLFADGAAVRKVGSETFRICNELVDEMVTVSTDEICSAIKDCFMDTRSILEPAGALGIAGLKKWAELSGTRDQTYVAICSGANMNFDSLRFVSERADSSETLLSVAIPERPGAFRRLISRIEPRNVTEFSYRHSGNGSEAAHIYLSFQAHGKDDVTAVLRAFKEDGCDALDLTDNELAKDHARHLAGGRSRVDNERVYRFEFPERQGALVNFLDSLNGGNGSTAAPWNVSLFHYRNHGGDVGRVLAGMQVPESDLPAFNKFLTQLHYPYFRECDNPAYKRFLAGS